MSRDVLGCVLHVDVGESVWVSWVSITTQNSIVIAYRLSGFLI